MNLCYKNFTIIVIIFILISKVDHNTERLSRSRLLDRGSFCSQSCVVCLCGYIHKIDEVHSHVSSYVSEMRPCLRIFSAFYLKLFKHLLCFSVYFEYM